MIKEFKTGFFIALSFLLTLGIVGITYAAFVNISAVNTTEILTADLMNDLINNQKDIESRVGGAVVPSGFVGSFALVTCPTGWSEYLPAQGRVIRGIDKTGTNIDPDGERSVGDIQTDAFQGHHHNVYDNQGGSTSSAYWHSGTSSPNMGAGYTRNTTVQGWGWKAKEAVTDGTNGTPNIGKETRSKNVALLYCVKD